MSFLNLAAIRECTEAEGPGKRFALWCQGCQRRCPGCCNPHMQPLVPVHILDVNDIKELIIASKRKYEIEGITCIGGEPFLQSEGIAELVHWCKANDLSVMIFTGFTFAELQDLIINGDINSKVILEHTDILVDGPFIELQYDTERDWVGSTNQKVIFLTDKYNQGVEYNKRERVMDIKVSVSDIAINGWPFIK